DQYADLGRVRLVDGQPGVGERLARREQGELAEAIEPPRLLRREQLLGVKILHLAGDRHVEVRRIEEADGADARLPFDQIAPGLGHAVPDWRDRAEPGDDDLLSHCESRLPSAPKPRGTSPRA